MALKFQGLIFSILIYQAFSLASARMALKFQGHNFSILLY